MTVEAIVEALLREDAAFMTPDRDDFVHLVEVALRRAYWKAPNKRVTSILLQAVDHEIERLVVAPVAPGK